MSLSFLPASLTAIANIDSLVEILKGIGIVRLIMMTISLVAVLLFVLYLKEKIKNALIKGLGKYYKNTDLDNYNDTVPTIYILDKLITYISFLLCVFIFMRFVGVKIGDLTILLGGTSILVVLGLQEFLKNFVGGLMVLFEHNLRIGDIIDLSGFGCIKGNGTKLAWVSEIRTRTTLLTTLDGKEIVIPNTDMVKFPIVNITLSTPVRRVHFPFFIPADKNLEELKVKILERMLEHPVCLKQPSEPTVWVKAIVPGCIQCEMVVWINQKRIKTSPTSLVGTILLKVLRENDALVMDRNLSYLVKPDEFSEYDTGY